MLQKYSFFCVFALLLSGLQWWSSHVVMSVDSAVQLETTSVTPTQNTQDELSQADLRRDLLETLDRLVILENYYHSIYGHYTQVLNHAGFSVPARLSRHYEIRVASAARDHFQVTAFSEDHGHIQDRVWVDQFFRVTANFSLPTPSVEYLKLRAAQQLKILSEQKPVQVFPEKGIFTGYFQYEVRRDSENRPVAIATGVKSPVLGVQLEAGSKQTLVGENHESADSAPNLSGEVGQYAREWSELAQVAENQLSDPLPNEFSGSDRHLAGLPQSLGPLGSVGDSEEHRPASDRLIIESIPKESSSKDSQ